MQSIAFMATIYDIAKELNITPSTVSRALSDHPRISAKTKVRVKSTAERLGYRPNGIASALRSGKTKVLGVIVPTANRSFFSSVVRGIEKVANQKGYNVMIAQSNDSEEQESACIDMLLKARVDGIILSMAKGTHHTQHFQKVQTGKTPLIFFDRISHQLDASAVLIDDFQGGRMATQHLIEQGYRCIAHFTGPQHINIYQDRLRGYQQALEDHNIPFDPQLVIESKHLKIDDGRAGVDQLLQQSIKPDAIFAASDLAAMGAMQALKTQGLQIPKDVGLVGFANEPFTDFVEPALTTVDQRSDHIGQLAAQLALEEIQHKEKPYMARKTVLSPSLVVRGSSLRLG